MPSGGKRPGAGRLLKAPEEKRQKISATLSPDAIAWVRHLAGRDRRSVSAVLDELIGFHQQAHS